MKIGILLGIAFLIQGAVSFQHTIAVPKALHVGAPETVVVNLHGYQQATIHAFLQDYPEREAVFGQTEPIDVAGDAINSPIPLEVTVRGQDILNFMETQLVTLTVNVRASNGGDFGESFEVLVSKESGYLFIITDRPIYKPEDSVSIKVFPLDQTMRQNPNTVVTLIIKTPDGIGVEKKALSLRADDSFVEYLYRINPIPEIGNWKIEAKYSAKGYETSTEIEFAVQRYVLPTFKVTIETTSNFILPNDRDIAGNILAEYSYGKKVYGNFFIAMKLKKTPASLPIQFYKYPGSLLSVGFIQNGRKSFSGPVANIRALLAEQGEEWSSLIENGGSVFIEATVTGRADGVLESARSRELPFVASPFKIDISLTPKYYTPGLAYRLQAELLGALGKSKASNVPVVIEVGTGNDIRFFQTSSDNRGQIDFQFVFQGADVQQIEVRTDDPDIADDDQASVSFVVEPYSSPSGSYLQVFSTMNLISVGQRNFQVTFRLSSSDVDEIRYFVIARGAIVFAGRNVPQENSRDSTQLLPVTQKMVPAARIVAYYLRDNGEVVSNSLWIDVVDQCETELSLQVPEEVLPGHPVNIEITGPSNALVSINGVDRAAYFLYDGSRLTRKSMFDKMDGYDQGCARTGGSDGHNVFLGAGVSLSSQGHLPAAASNLNCTQDRRRKKRQAVVQAASDDMDAQLLKCREDGGLIRVVRADDCRIRAARVLKNFGDIIPDCDVEFLEGCVDGERNRRFALIIGAGRSNGVGQAEAAKSIARLRTDFSENLLFTDVRLNEQGQATVPRRARDSITTFDIDAVSMQDSEDGFCVAEPAELRVFKDVFIQLKVPYSLKKREQANLIITVFNYNTDTDYEFDLEVFPPDDGTLCTRYRAGDWTTLIRNFPVARRNSASTSLSVLPLTIPNGGFTPISVRISGAEGGIFDAIEKEILIEEPGEIQDSYGSSPIDLKNDRRQTLDINFDFPDGYIPGTRECTLYAYVNFLGPSIEVDPITKEPNNIASIFRQPYGCGEQNMLVCGPNVFAHAYLIGAGKMVPGSAQETQSIARMKEGYTRELSYRATAVQKRAFSVWAHYPPSIWLNAYVDKVFAKAKEYAEDLDIGPVCSSLDWLLSRQVNGRFTEARPAIHREMHGAVGGPLTLTTYVVVTFLETPSRCSPELAQRVQAGVDDAVEYLRTNKNHATFMERPYALALLSYALALNNPNSAFAQEIHTRLLGLRTVEDGKAYWERASNVAGTDLHAYWYDRRPEAITIEATAYALLAQIEMSRATNPVPQHVLDQTRETVLWLICQRNEGGAFRSTQDTVIGLQALATYQSWIANLDVGVQDVDINLQFNAPNSVWEDPGHHIHLDRDNEGFKELIKVPDSVKNVGHVTVTATGEGEGLVSYRCTYRTLVNEEACHFQVDQDLKITNERDRERNNVPIILKMTLTISKPIGNATQMALVEIGLLSGYVPVLQTIERITSPDVVDGIVDRYEITNNKINLYLNSIDHENVTISFDMTESVPVAKPEPATLKIYDYYEPSVQCNAFYSLPNEHADLQTANCNDNEDAAGMCKCAEGGCLTCRTRDEQLSNTNCLTAAGLPCSICDNGEACENMFDVACRSNYVYVVRVTEVNEPAPGDIFYSFSAEVLNISKRGDDGNVDRSSIVTFTTRRDCFSACEDPTLQEAARTKGTNPDYVREGVELVVIGSKPDVQQRNGAFDHKYRLDETAVLERHISDSKCAQSRRNYEDTRKPNCRDPNAKRNRKQKAKCLKLRKFVEACDAFQRFTERLEEGCDT